MVKNILLISLVMMISLTGCVQTNSSVDEQDVSETKVQKVKKKDTLSSDERKIMYKGDYNIQYKEPRVVWFKPMLTGKGNVISERTVALAPKDMRWAQDEERTNVGSKFKELTKDGK